MNKDISGSNGPDTITVSANSPFMDLLDHMVDSYEDAAMLVADLANYRGFLEEAIAVAVTRARECGEGWGTIGDALGTSKQAAQQRYGGHG